MLLIDHQITSKINDACMNIEVTDEEPSENELVSEIVDKVFSQLISQRKSLLDEPLRKRRRSQFCIDNPSRPVIISPLPCQPGAFMSRVNGSCGVTAITESPNSSKPSRSACRTRNRPCNQFGPISGIPVGSFWSTLNEIQSVHGTVNNIIHGNRNTGAYSLLLSTLGGPEGRDDGEQVLLCLGGSMKLKNLNGDTLQGHKRTLALNCNAKLNGVFGNHSTNWRAGKPVRVIRSSQLRMSSIYAPAEGFRYDGVYKVCSYRRVFRRQRFFTWLFVLRRDDELPTPWDSLKISVTLDHNYFSADNTSEAQLQTIEIESPRKMSERSKEFRETLLSSYNRLLSLHSDIKSKWHIDNSTMGNLKTEPVRYGADVQFRQTLDHNYFSADDTSEAQVQTIEIESPRKMSERSKEFRETLLSSYNRLLSLHSHIKSEWHIDNPTMGNSKTEPVRYGANVQFSAQRPSSSNPLVHGLRETEELSNQQRPLLESITEKQSPSTARNSARVDVYDFNPSIEYTTEKQPSSYRPYHSLRKSKNLSSRQRLLLESPLEECLSNLAGSSIQDNICISDSKTSDHSYSSKLKLVLQKCISDSKTSDHSYSSKLKCVLKKHSSNHAGSSIQSDVCDFDSEASSTIAKLSFSDKSIGDSCNTKKISSQQPRLRETEELSNQQRPLLESITEKQSPSTARNSAHIDVHDFNSTSKYTPEKRPSSYPPYHSLRKSKNLSSRQRLLLESPLEECLSNLAESSIQDNICIFDSKTSDHSYSSKLKLVLQKCISDSKTSDHSYSSKLKCVLKKHSSNHAGSSIQSDVCDFDSKGSSIIAKLSSSDTSLGDSCNTEKLASQQPLGFEPTTITPPSGFAGNSTSGEVHHFNLEFTAEKQPSSYSSVCVLPKADELVSQQPLSELETFTGPTKSTTEEQVSGDESIRVPEEIDAPVDVKPPLLNEHREEELSTLKSVFDSEESSVHEKQSSILELSSNKQPSSPESADRLCTTNALSQMQPIVLIPKVNENQLRNHTANEIEQMLKIKSNLHTSVCYSRRSSSWTQLPEDSSRNETRKTGYSNFIKQETESNDALITGTDESNKLSPIVAKKQSSYQKNDLTLSQMQPIVLIPRLYIDQAMPCVKEESIDADLVTSNHHHSATTEIRETITSDESEFEIPRKPTSSPARTFGRANTPTLRTRSMICASHSSKLTSDLDTLASDSVAVCPALLSKNERIILPRSPHKPSSAKCSSLSYENEKVCVRRSPRNSSGKSISELKTFNGSNHPVVPDCDKFEANLLVPRTFNTESGTAVNIKMEGDCNHIRIDLEDKTNERLFARDTWSPMLMLKIEENATSARVISREVLQLARKDKWNQATWDYLEGYSHNDSEFLKQIELTFTCPSCDGLASVTLPCQHNACSMCLTTRYLNKIRTCPYPYCCEDVGEILHKTDRGNISVYENWILKKILKKLFPHRF